jgi:hypothetical protein
VVSSSSRLGPDLGFGPLALAELDLALFERFGGEGTAVAVGTVDWLGLSVREAFELCGGPDLTGARR